MKPNKKMNILVCGSQKFDDQSFVFGVLNTFFKQTEGKVGSVFTSQFSGACQFAKCWVNAVNENLPVDKQVKNMDCTFDNHLSKQNFSFYEEANIPEFLIQADPFFQKGKEKLIENGISLVLMFPNDEGKLGASTKNIMRFATLASIKFLDCSDLYDLIKAQRQDMLPETPKEEKNGLQNHHGMKRI